MATVIPSALGAAFVETMTKTMLQSMQQAHEATLQKNDLEYKRYVTDFGQAMDAIGVAAAFSPEGSTFDELFAAAPGLTQSVDRVLGEGASQGLIDSGVPVKPETLTSIMMDRAAALREEDPETFNRVMEHSFIWNAAQIQGGAAGMDLQGALNMIQKQGVDGIFQSMRNGDVSAGRAAWLAGKVMKGEQPSQMIEIAGQTFEVDPADAMRGWLAHLDWQNEFLRISASANPDPNEAMKLLKDQAERASDELWNRYKIDIGAQPMQSLLIAMETPALNSDGTQKTSPQGVPLTQFDELYAAQRSQDPTMWDAVYHHFNGLQATSEGMFNLALLQPENRDIAETLSALAALKEMNSDPEAQLRLTQDVLNTMRERFPNMPIGVIESGVRSNWFNTNPSFKPGTGPQGGAGVSTTPGSGIGAPAKSWDEQTNAERVETVARLLPHTTEDALRTAGVPSNIIAAARNRTSAASPDTTGSRATLRSQSSVRRGNPNVISPAVAESLNMPRNPRQHLEQSLGAQSQLRQIFGRTSDPNATLIPGSPFSVSSAQAAEPERRPIKIGAVTVTDPDLAWLIDKESDGRPTAQNPTSTAFGIGQLLVANRREYGRRLGINPNTTNPQEQLAMMNAYIADRYGTTQAARRFHEEKGWY